MMQKTKFKFRIPGLLRFMHFEVVKGVLVLAGLLALCPPAFFSHLCPALGICGHSNSDVQVMCYLFKQLPLSHF